MKIPISIYTTDERRRQFVLDRRPALQSAFTMVEIALCLAIIGFALVAIIGALNPGLNVQKDNRQETIINQDANVWMDAIRNGSSGYDDLTKYVIAITNKQWLYTQSGTDEPVLSAVNPNPDVYVYTPLDSTKNGVAMNPPYRLTNGARIVGLLSKPKIEWTPSGFLSNYTVANVLAMSGAAVEKPPQDDAEVLQSAFSYRMAVEVYSYVPFNPNATNYLLYTNNPAAWVPRSNYWRVATSLKGNSSDIRLNFAWPRLPNGVVGNGRQTFRLFTGGILSQSYDYPYTNIPLYFLQSSTYR